MVIAFIIKPARRATLARLAHPVAADVARRLGRVAESTPARLAHEYALAAAREAADPDAGWGEEDLRAVATQGLELYLMGVVG